jgi:transcriptional regulator with XRE-family HTH domain
MKLSDYLSANGMTYRAFAAQAGRSVTQIHRWATKQRVPDLESALVIERITGGAVRPADFVENGNACACTPEAA